MAAPSDFYNYFQAIKENQKLVDELNLTAEQTVLLNKTNAELSDTDRAILKKSVKNTQTTIVEIWKEKQPTKFQKYFNSIKNDSSKITELKLTERQTLLLNKNNDDLTDSERTELKQSVTPEQKQFLLPKSSSGKTIPTYKKLTKAEIKIQEEKDRAEAIAANSEEQKKIVHLFSELNILTRFEKHVLAYTPEEIKDFKDKLTKFQSSIDTKIKEAKEAKLKADKEAAQAKIDALKKQIEDAAAELKKLEELEQK